MNMMELNRTYYELLSDIKGIEEEKISLYAYELATRHMRGWSIPMSTYRAYHELLIYKDSLCRHSPYYRDLLDIKNRNDLKKVLRALCRSMKIKYRNVGYISREPLKDPLNELGSKPSHICALCHTTEYPSATIVDNSLWFCESCLNRIRELLNII